MTDREDHLKASDQDAFCYELSDDAIEAACGAANCIPTVLNSSYCFTCPDLPLTRSS